MLAAIGAALFLRADLVPRPYLFARGAVLLGAAALIAAPIAQGAVVYSVTDAMFTAMRLLAYVIFLHLPVWGAVAAWRLRTTARRRAAVSVACVVVVVGIGVDAFLVEPTALEVRTVTIESSKVTRPIRIALVADVQTDGPTDYERRALERVAAAKPDLVVYAGDYAHADDWPSYLETMKRLNAMLRAVAIDAPLGQFAVRGNVDAPDHWTTLFDGTSIRAREPTTRYAVDAEVEVAALSFSDSFDDRLQITPSDRFLVAFGHGPDFALGDVPADLMLAGHTHGGQVQLPFVGPIVTLSKVPRAWASGVTRFDDGRTLIVARGVGLERGPAPRLRFLCRPELVFIEVRPAS
ncbi:MAG: metallophosphoesterase [Deltaproteobacteria bacterium]